MSHGSLSFDMSFNCTFHTYLGIFLLGCSQPEKCENPRLLQFPFCQQGTGENKNNKVHDCFYQFPCCLWSGIRLWEEAKLAFSDGYEKEEAYWYRSEEWMGNFYMVGSKGFSGKKESYWPWKKRKERRKLGIGLSGPCAPPDWPSKFGSLVSNARWTIEA